MVRDFLVLSLIGLVCGGTAQPALLLSPASAAIPQLRTSFVAVRDGIFYDPNGTRLVLNGVGMFVYSPLDVDERDFWAIKHAGLNEVRLLISWRFLEPKFGVYDSKYVNEIDQLRSWSEKYGLYITVTLMNVGDTSPRTPFWLQHWSRVYNATGMHELLNTWKLLSKLFKDDSNLIAYEIPWNEAYPPDYNADNATYVQAMQQGVNMTHLWEQWLMARYGTIQALNSTWNAHIYDQLNGTGNPPYRPIDFTSGRGYSGEDHWNGIKPLGPYSYNFQYNPINPSISARWTDWQLFRLDLLASMTRQVADAIRSFDPNHVLATFVPNTTGFGQGEAGDKLLPRLAAEVPQIQALAYHQYLNPNSPETWPGQGGKSAYFGHLLASESFLIPQVLPGIAVWHDEWGAMDSGIGGTPAQVGHGPNHVSMVMSQDEIGGFVPNGWTQMVYRNSGQVDPGSAGDVVNYFTGEFEGSYYHLKYFMPMQDSATYRNPDVLLIVPQWIGQNYLYESQIFPFLALHVTMGMVEESYVTTALLSNFKAAVYWFSPGAVGTNRTTVGTIVEWAKAGHYVLWLGAGNDYDSYFRSGRWSPLIPFEGYMFSPGAENSVTRPPGLGTGNIVFSKSFGGIPAGTVLQVPFWPQGVAIGYDQNNVVETNGQKVIASDSKTRSYALWYNETSVFYYGPLSPPILTKWDVPVPTSYSDPFVTLTRAFFKFAGIWYDDQTDYNIQYRYDSGGGFLIGYERLGLGGTYTLRLDLQHEGIDPAKSYTVLDVMNQTAYNRESCVPGTALANQPLSFQANQTILLKIITPCTTVQVSQSYSISTGATQPPILRVAANDIVPVAILGAIAIIVVILFQLRIRRRKP